MLYSPEVLVSQSHEVQSSPSLPSELDFLKLKHDESNFYPMQNDHLASEVDYRFPCAPSLAAIGADSFHPLLTLTEYVQ